MSVIIIAVILKFICYGKTKKAFGLEEPDNGQPFVGSKGEATGHEQEGGKEDERGSGKEVVRDQSRQGPH